MQFRGESLSSLSGGARQGPSNSIGHWFMSIAAQSASFRGYFTWPDSNPFTAWFELQGCSWEVASPGDS
jgi:hypothetical protein